MTTDLYKGSGDDLYAPASTAEAVVVGTPFAFASKRLWVGGAGNLTVTLVGGGTVTYSAPAGAYLNVRATEVTAATASNIVAEH